MTTAPTPRAAGDEIEAILNEAHNDASPDGSYGWNQWCERQDKRIARARALVERQAEVVAAARYAVEAWKTGRYEPQNAANHALVNALAALPERGHG